uniref:RUN and SH3 domain containing 1 n=1 Tax=Astyanax mexicanus TaxID=7994 RepID=A0A8B9RDJ1_ASTMX
MLFSTINLLFYMNLHVLFSLSSFYCIHGDIGFFSNQNMFPGELYFTSSVHRYAVRSLSFAGSAAKAAWMGSDVRPPLRGDGLSSLFLQEKRALVSVVSVAVEAILAQFSSSRTLVQKFPSVEQALSGDSSVNPTLGRLVLQCLCPALRDLLSDGLKPHQSDLIAGRRPNSPWGLVQASTKPGSNTQALYILQAKVAALPQLKHSRHRFNSFLLGLLNIKRLDFWLSHLQSCSDVLETYYRPTAFMRLSSTSCQHLFEELLLLLQPLSLLTFNLDLLFQHHHLDPSSPDLTPVTYSSPGMSRPPNRGFSFHLLPTYQSEASAGHLKGASKQEPAGVQSGLKSSSSTLSFSPAPVQVQCRPPAAIAKGETSPQLQWLKEKEIEAPPSDGSGNSLSQQAGQALQQGWGAVMRWGERLGQNLGGLASAGWSEEGKGFDTVRDLNTYPATNALKSPGQEDMMVDGVPWGLGRLFGASKSPSNPPSKRRPSQWLSPGITALTRMTGAGHAFLPDKIEPGRKEEKEKDRNEERKQADDQPKPLRAVRTLCDHAGTGAELTFRKGEELIVLGSVDQDWIRCRQGDKEGLVPIGYASLIA